MCGIPVVSGSTFPGSAVTHLIDEKTGLGLFLVRRFQFDLLSFVAFIRVLCNQGRVYGGAGCINHHFPWFGNTDYTPRFWLIWSKSDFHGRQLHYYTNKTQVFVGSRHMSLLSFYVSAWLKLLNEVLYSASNAGQIRKTKKRAPTQTLQALTRMFRGKVQLKQSKIFGENP